MPPIERCILQQSCNICNLLRVVGLCQTKEILGLRGLDKNILRDLPIECRRILWLYVHCENRSLGLLLRRSPMQVRTEWKPISSIQVSIAVSSTRECQGDVWFTSTVHSSFIGVGWWRSCLCLMHGWWLCCSWCRLCCAVCASCLGYSACICGSISPWDWTGGTGVALPWGELLVLIVVYKGEQYNALQQVSDTQVVH